MRRYDKVKIVKFKELKDKEGIILNVLVENKTYEVFSEGMIVVLDRSQIQPLRQSLELKTLTLPKLNGLDKIDLVSTMLKIAEETGELSQVIGKKRGMNGEKEVLEESKAFEEIGKELLDVAQTAISMIYVLEEQHGLKMDKLIDKHIEKLIRKGYVC